MTTRTLSRIARDIRADWSKVNFGALPYLRAMETLETVNDNFMMDSGDSIVRYFLSNATTWRGDVARRIKAELKGML